jgi:hypothetical protein
VYRSLEWVTDSLVNILGAVPGDGVPIVFTRTIPKDALLHDYSNGAAIEEINLDESNLQTIMSVHEFLDGRIEGGFLSDLNMNGYRLTNLGPGVEDDDAATVAQLNEMTDLLDEAEAAATASDVARAASVVAKDASVAAKDLAQLWASSTAGLVAATDYSARAWAFGSYAVNPYGSAKAWAVTGENTTVDGVSYSALHWAAKAQAYAAAVNLPAITVTDTGSIIQVNAAGTGYQKLNPSDEGKVLTCHGTDTPLTWESIPGIGTVAITSGGTGQTTAVNAFNALKQPADLTTTGVVELATPSEVTAGADSSRVPAVATMKYHPGSAKAWVNFTASGGTVIILDSYGVNSVSDNGVGNYTVNFTLSFANSAYAVVCGSEGGASGWYSQTMNEGDYTGLYNKTASSVRVKTKASNGGQPDFISANVTAFGDL